MGNFDAKVHNYDRYFGTGVFFGKIMCMVICVDFIFLMILAWICPDEEIDRAPKWDAKRYEELRREPGDVLYSSHAKKYRQH
jgi:hypothetical protein